MLCYIKVQMWNLNVKYWKISSALNQHWHTWTDLSHCSNVVINTHFCIFSARGCHPNEPTMPIELAMPIYLTNEEFLNLRVSKYSRPLRPCLHRCQSTKLSFGSPREQPESNGSSAPLTIPGRAKKQVSFADHKGLTLTMVKVFSEFDDPIDIPTNIVQFFTSSVTLPEGKDKLTLDFDQPSADYLKFRQRIENDHLCLEHCMLKEKSIAGTVKVKNLSFEKSVKASHYVWHLEKSHRHRMPVHKGHLHRLKPWHLFIRSYFAWSGSSTWTHRVCHLLWGQWRNTLGQ